MAFGRGESLGCESIQIFVKNASRWKAAPLDEATVEDFSAAWDRSSIGPVVAHAAYLINLASSKDEVRERSILALVDELTRCRRLGLDGLVFHPGAHLGSGEEAGIDAIVVGVNRVLQETPQGRTRLLFETTAGQGTVLGYRLEQIQAMLEGVESSDSAAVCLDTCHLLAAGYPIGTPDGMTDLLDEVIDRFGIDRLACIHANDSKHPQGSRKDRHCNLGDGYLGRESMLALVADSRLTDVPVILETPAGEDLEGHRRDLGILRRNPVPGSAERADAGGGS